MNRDSSHSENVSDMSPALTQNECNNVATTYEETLKNTALEENHNFHKLTRAPSLILEQATIPPDLPTEKLRLLIANGCNGHNGRKSTLTNGTMRPTLGVRIKEDSAMSPGISIQLPSLELKPLSTLDGTWDISKPGMQPEVHVESMDVTPSMTATTIDEASEMTETFASGSEDTHIIAEDGLLEETPSEMPRTVLPKSATISPPVLTVPVLEVKEELKAEPEPEPTLEDVSYHELGLKKQAATLIQRIRLMQNVIVNQQMRHSLAKLVEYQHSALRDHDKLAASSEVPVPSTSRCPARDKVEEAACLSRRIRDRLHGDLDSDATMSSSGSDTDDDMNYSNVKATTRSKRPCERWAKDRAAVISRWTWLQAQVSDLEYRIRQHGDIHRQLRAAKPPVLLADAAVTDVMDSSQRAVRCLPYNHNLPRRHKLLRMSKAPSLSHKARKRITVRCQCVQAVRECATCAGHHNYALPADMDLVSSRERIGLIDPSFHPVLSFDQDIDPGIELESVMGSSERRHTAINMKKVRKMKKEEALASKIKKKKDLLEMKQGMRKKALKNNKDKKKKQKKRSPVVESEDEYDFWEQSDTEPDVSQRKKHSKKEGKKARFEDDEWLPSDDGTPTVAAAVDIKDYRKVVQRRESNKYDLDNIVIPYHIAATTRVEKLQYKEIDTPRWREYIVDPSSVHERRSTSSVPSTPITPITPLITKDLDLVLSAPPAIVTEDEEPSTPTQPPTPTPLSEHSSSASLSTLKDEEDVSYEAFAIRHDKMETKERSRYLNFITVSARSRTRTISTTTSNKGATTPGVEPSAPTLSLESPLSQSHGEVQLREDLAPSKQLRSSSFSAGKMSRRELSAGDQLMAEEVVVPPWVPRAFPLLGNHVLALDETWTAPEPANIPVVKRPEWKVVNLPDDNKEAPLVLKLTKASTQ